MNSGVVDLRSDTVTRPTPAMRAAMLRAELGDDVFGDDPTVNAPAGARSPRCSARRRRCSCPAARRATWPRMHGPLRPRRRVHRRPGRAHLPLRRRRRGRARQRPAAAAAPTRPTAPWRWPTSQRRSSPTTTTSRARRLLALENTIGGGCCRPTWPRPRALARRRGLATHLDGARLCNAAVARAATRGDASDAGYFDTVSVCFSKGLGAPVGSVLAGRSEFIAARPPRRKLLGGGMRQAGVLAAAACMRSSTTSTAWPTTMLWPHCWPRA